MIKELISFYNKRVYIPEKHRGLVLDVGSGDKPHFRADILVDKFIDKKFGVQRNGTDEVSIKKPLFVSDISKMPFKDKVFDYVIASHVLEHVIDPAACIREIVRVGKAGYIELPYVGYQKITDFISHLWYCDYSDKTIIFTAKKDSVFDNDIESFVGQDPEAGLNISIKNEDKCVIEIRWQNNVKFRVIGKPAKKLINKIGKTRIDHNYLILMIRNILGFFIETVISNQNKAIHYNEITKKEFHLEGNPLLKRQLYYPKKR